MKEILITSSVLIVALLLLRWIFAKKVSRILIYSAWALVALRLLIPVQIGQLDFSVLAAATPVTEAITQVVEKPVSGQTKEDVYTDIVVDYIEKDPSVFIPEVQEQIREETQQGTINRQEILDKIQQKHPEKEIFVPEVQQQVQQQVEQTADPITLGQITTTLWLTGVVIMAAWFAIVNLRHSRMLRKNRERLDVDSPVAVYLSKEVATPCLVGLFRPEVYLTPESAENPVVRRHVLTHELTHYRHRDHIWSLVRCVCLCVYWFNPLVWVAAWFSRRDCELACDEGALMRLGENERIAYGESLLDVVSRASRPANLMRTATAMNETKKQLKERVNFIVKKRKNSILYTTFLVLILALCSLVTMVGCASKAPDPELIYDVFAEDRDRTEGEVIFKLSEFSNLQFMRDGVQYHVKRGDRWDRIVMNGEKVIAADLNGDGKRELVSSTSVGSGIVDNRIYVYDIVNDMSYCLERRGENDFDIVLEDGKLVAQRFEKDSVWDKKPPIDTGELKIKKGQLYYICEDEKVQGVVENAAFNMEFLQNKIAEFRGDMDKGWGMPSVLYNDATEYYMDRYQAVLQPAIQFQTEISVTFEYSKVQDVDVLLYLYLIDFLTHDNPALGFPARYVYMDPRNPEQLFICTELRDTKYSDIRAYYDALVAGKCKAHKDTYVVRLDDQAVYRWGKDKNLFDSRSGS